MRGATLAVFFANGIGIGSWAAAIPTLKATLALTDAELSLALLAFAAGALVCMPLCSALTPRLGGTGRTTRLAGFAFAFLLPMPMLPAGLPLLCTAALLLGASNGMLDVTMNAHATGVERRWGVAIMSSFHAAYSLGAIGGAACGSALLALATPAPWLLVPAALLALALMLFAAPRLGPGDREETGSVALRIPERGVIGLAAVALLCLLVEGAMTDWSALYLTAVGASAASASAGFVAFSAMMVLGRLLGDRVVRAFGRQRVVAAGALLAAAGLALAAALPQVPAIAVGFACVGLGLSNVVPALFSASAQRGSSPAAGIAATATAGYAGLLAGPPLIGAIATGWSLRVGMGVMALLVLVASVMCVAGRKLRD